jgi:hypothetical protein
MFADHSLIFATSPPKLENLVEITLKKPKFQVENKQMFAQKKTLVLISPNLAKLSYGLSPLQLHHKIDKIDPKKKKKNPEYLIKIKSHGCYGRVPWQLGERQELPWLL